MVRVPKHFNPELITDPEVQRSLRYTLLFWKERPAKVDQVYGVYPIDQSSYVNYNYNYKYWTKTNFKKFPDTNPSFANHACLSKFVFLPGPPTTEQKEEAIEKKKPWNDNVAKWTELCLCEGQFDWYFVLATP